MIAKDFQNFKKRENPPPSKNKRRPDENFVISNLVQVSAKAKKLEESKENSSSQALIRIG